MKFNEDLEKGKFLIAKCNQCKKIVWPPSEFCNKCFNEVSWLESKLEGEIIEFSKQGDQYFAVVELEQIIRIMGKISFGIPKIGKKVNMVKCGMKNSSPFYEFSIM